MTITYPPEGGLRLGDDVEVDFDRCYQAHGGELNDSFYKAARMFYVSGAMDAADSLRGQTIPLDPSAAIGRERIQELINARKTT